MITLDSYIFITVSIVTIFRHSDSVVLAFFPFLQPYYGVTWGTRICEWHRPEFQPGFLLLPAEWLSVSNPVFRSLNFCFYYMGIALPTSPVRTLRWDKGLKPLSTAPGSWGAQLVLLVLPPVMRKEIWIGQLKIHNSDSFSYPASSCRCSLHLQLRIYLFILLVCNMIYVACVQYYISASIRTACSHQQKCSFHLPPSCWLLVPILPSPFPTCLLVTTTLFSIFMCLFLFSLA